jgi:hypothetical protein
MNSKSVLLIDICQYPMVSSSVFTDSYIFQEKTEGEAPVLAAINFVKPGTILVKYKYGHLSVSFLSRILNRINYLGLDCEILISQKRFGMETDNSEKIPQKIVSSKMLQFIYSRDIDNANRESNTGEIKEIIQELTHKVRGNLLTTLSIFESYCQNPQPDMKEANFADIVSRYNIIDDSLKNIINKLDSLDHDA